MNKHLLQLLFTLTLLPVFGQVKYSQDFEGSTSDMIFLDQDKNLQYTQLSIAFKGTWLVRTLDGNPASNKWATSNSWFSPEAAADDWMITPVIKDITAKTILKWDAFSTDPNYTDTYEVRLSLGGKEVADFSDVLISVPFENPYVDQRGVSLAAYAGKEIRIAFRNISDNRFFLNIDNISVLDARDSDLTLKGASTKNYVLKGRSADVKFSVKNLGNKTITKFTAEWTDGVQKFSQDFTGLSLSPFATYNGKFKDKFKTIDADYTDIKVTLKSVNGGVNENTNIEAQTRTHGLEQAIQRKMVVEEATGTWCTWCPRGAVNMALMKENYPNEFIGIAVHNAGGSTNPNPDPMAVEEYDSGLTSLDGFSGFPSVVINRESIEDPADMDSLLKSNIRNDFAPAVVDVSSSLSGRTLTIDGTVKFNTSFGSTDVIKVIGVLIEDNVKGTTKGFAQINSYAGGTNGVMGGYEKLPNPVPASKMVYNEVGRELLYGFEGKDISQGKAIAAGDEYNFLFDYDVKNEYDINNVSMVFMVADGNGIIIGGNKTESKLTVTNDINEVVDLVALAPNHTSDVAYLTIKLKESNEVNVKIFNQIGQVVAAKVYGSLSGEQVLPINAQEFNAGMYFVKLTVGSKTTTQKLIVE
jgi:thiol-disulfide isomerase/thioredoxin